MTFRKIEFINKKQRKRKRKKEKGKTKLTVTHQSSHPYKTVAHEVNWGGRQKFGLYFGVARKHFMSHELDEDDNRSCENHGRKSHEFGRPKGM